MRGANAEAGFIGLRPTAADRSVCEIGDTVVPGVYLGIKYRSNIFKWLFSKV